MANCLTGGPVGQDITKVEKLTPEQQELVRLLAGQAAPAIEQVPMTATIPGMEFQPGGPSQLQQQAFGMAGQDISQMMAPVSQFAQQQFQQEYIPSIMGALGSQGMARSSGAPEILGRQARNLNLGMAAQFAPMQFQQPGMMAGLGGMQRGIGEEQRQFGLQRFLAGAPEASPRLGFIGPAFQSAYDTAVHQGYYDPGILGPLVTGLGSFGSGGGLGGMSDIRLKENIEHIDNALEKVENLDGLTYNLKTTPENRDGGIIAQDLEKVLPEAVVEINGIKYVKYFAVIALLVNSVKELNQKVEKEIKNVA